MRDRKITTRSLLDAAMRYWISYRLSVHFEVGIEAWGRRRVDIAVLDFKANQIIFCEAKSCAADFDSDKKFRNYLPYCHKFFFVVPQFYWDSPSCDRLREAAKEVGAGVLVVNERGARSVKKHGPSRKELPVGFKKSLITKLAWRAGHNHITVPRQRNVSYEAVE